MIALGGMTHVVAGATERFEETAARFR